MNPREASRPVSGRLTSRRMRVVFLNLLALALLLASPNKHAETPAALAADCSATGVSTWTLDHFMIAAWQGPSVYGNSTENQQAMQAAHDLSLDTILGFPGTEGESEPHLVEALQNANALGMKVLVGSKWFSKTCDYIHPDSCGAKYWGVGLGLPWEEYCLQHQDCFDPLEACTPCIDCTPHYYNSISSTVRPAILGYYVCDEPSLAEAESVKVRVAAVSRQDPTRLAFFNLYPYVPELFASRGGYEEYLRELTTDADPARQARLVSFDRYPFHAAPESGPTPVDTSYFYNLSAVRSAAGARPFIATILTKQLSGHADPTESTIRFETSCAIAYGARGVAYFGYIDDLVTGYDSPTALYAPVQRLNRFLAGVVGPVVMGSDHLGAFHQANTPWGETISASETVSPNTTPLVASLGEANMLVGVFRSSSSPTVYSLWVANKDLSTRTAQVSLKGNLASSVWISPAEPNFVSDTTYAQATTSFNSTTNRTVVSFSLAAGEGRMLRVTGVNSPHHAFLRTDYDGDGISDLSARTASGEWVVDASRNGFQAVGTSGWEWSFSGYSIATVAAMADYDGDGRADLSAKSDSGAGGGTGSWRIDYAKDGYGAWNESYWGYGPSTAEPAAFDYDGDRKADLAVKTSWGEWLINYAADNDPPDQFGAWNDNYSYPLGLTATTTAVPGDYDGDGRGDIASWDPSIKRFRVDFAANDFGAWDDSSTYVGSLTQPVPITGDYDGDLKWDFALSCFDRWHIDYAVNGFNTWVKNIRQQSSAFEDFLAVPGDYDGDGKWDLAVALPDGSWKIDLAANGLGGLAGWDRTYTGYDMSIQFALHHAPSQISDLDQPFRLTIDGGPIQRGSIRLRLSSGNASSATVNAFDARGRHLGRVFEGPIGVGETLVTWPGRGSTGRRLPTGVYWIQARSGAESATSKFVLLP